VTQCRGDARNGVEAGTCEAGRQHGGGRRRRARREEAEEEERGGESRDFSAITENTGTSLETKFSRKSKNRTKM
jgi:hypothetical protein